MGIKIPGLLKSTAFQTGVMQNLNTRFDRMRDNSEAYQTAARKKGQELSNAHKATTIQLQNINKAKMNIASQFENGAVLADFLDSNGDLELLATTSKDAKEFFALADARAASTLQAGIPEDFEQIENPYYGTQRYEDYTKSYNTWKEHTDKQNDVFGNSYEALNDTINPTLMSAEDFGVTSREDITSLNRSGGAAKEIKQTDLTAMNKIVDQNGAWPNKGFTRGLDGTMTAILDEGIQNQVSTAKVISNIHYKYASGNISDAASQGIILTKNIASYAETSEDYESMKSDIKGIDIYLSNSLPGAMANANEYGNTYAYAIDLYFYTVSQKAKPQDRKKTQENITKLRTLILDETGISVPNIFGVEKYQTISRS
jgi:hypothetical protein